MKKLLVLILAMVMTMGSFAGCGDGSGRDKNTLWIGAIEAGYGLEWLQASIDVFNEKYPEYHVEIHEHDAQFHELATQRLQTGKTVNDLIITYDIMAENFSTADMLEDLSDVYNAPFGDDEGNTIEDALLPSAKLKARSHGVDGELSYYSFPTGSSTSSFILNRSVSDHYEKMSGWRGKKIDQVKTVKDLNAWVNQIMTMSVKSPFKYLDGTGEGPVKGFSYPGQYMNYWDGILKTWWVQYSGYDTYQSFFDLNDVSAYEDEGRLNAYKAFDSLNLSETSVPGSVSAEHISSQNAFVSGKSVLIPNGSWMEYESRGTIASWGAKIEMIPIPWINEHPKHKTTFYSTGGNIALVPKRSDCNVELAKKFLSFLFSKEEVLRCEKMTGQFGPYYNGYDRELVENMETYSDFSENVINLRNNAEVVIADVPKTDSSPNYRMIKTGIAKQFPKGPPYSVLIEHKTTPKDYYDEEIEYAKAQFDTWREQCGLK